MTIDQTEAAVPQHALTTQEDWTLPFDTPAEAVGALVTHGDRAFVAIGGEVYAIDAKTGVVLATFSIALEDPYTLVPGASFALPPDGSALLFGVMVMGAIGLAVMVYSLDPVTLTQNWSTPTYPFGAWPETNFDATQYMEVAVACSDTLVHVAVAGVYMQLAADTGVAKDSQVMTALTTAGDFSPYSNIALSPDNAQVCVVSSIQAWVLNIASNTIQTNLEFPTVCFNTVDPYYMGTISSIVATRSNFIVGFFGYLCQIPYDGGNTMSTHVPFAVGPGLPVIMSISPDKESIYVASGSEVAQLDLDTLQSNWTASLPMGHSTWPPNLLASNSLCYIGYNQASCSALAVFDNSGQNVDILTGSAVAPGGVPMLGGLPASNFPPMLAAAGADRLLFLSGNVLVALRLSKKQIEGLADKWRTDGPGPWMARMSGHIGAKPLRQIRIPGSHDSGTYNITDDSRLGMDAESLAKYGDMIGEVARWAKAQGVTFLEQLNAGIRYLDLRVQAGERGYEITHGKVSVGLDQLFEQLQAFYRNTANANEIIILDFQRFFGFDLKEYDIELYNEYDSLCKSGISGKEAIKKMKIASSQSSIMALGGIDRIYNIVMKSVEKVQKSRGRMQAMIDTVCEQIGWIQPAGAQVPAVPGADAPPFLIPASLGVSVTPNQIWNGFGRVMIVWKDDGNTDFAANPFLWPRTSTLTSPWADVNNVSDLKEELDKYLKKTYNNFFVLQGVLTPDTITIIDHISGVGLKKLGITPSGPSVDGLPYASLKDMALTLRV